MPFFTIFTPTYNRGYILPKLYESLQRQTCKDFEWLIVDDGSKDNTKDIVENWLNRENGFKIEYYKIPNGGKPRAINFGLQYAKGKYFFMVDSDDFLLENAVEKMQSWCMEIDNEEEFIGVGAARGFSKTEYIKGNSPIVNGYNFVDATNLERAKYNLDADMCEAYKIDIFKKFPMAEFENEKFAPEQIALNEISLSGYKLRWHKDIIYICEYLEDGLTKGSFDLEKANPIGYAMMYNHMLKYPNLSIKDKYKAACQHVALIIYSKKLKYLFQTNNWKYTLFAVPVGILLSIRRWIQFQKGGND